MQLLSSHDKIGIIAVSNKILLFKNEEVAKQYTSNNSNIANNSNSNSTTRIGGSVNVNDDKANNDTLRELRVYAATRTTKKRIIDFIENLNQTQEATNHPLGFKYAFALLKQLYEQKNVNDPTSSSSSASVAAEGNMQKQQQQNNYRQKELPITFLYVTRGLLFPLTEARTVMNTIAKGQTNIPFPVVINTCAVIIDEKRIMYEKQFLNDVISQNYTKYGIEVPAWLTQKTVEGKLYSLTDPTDANTIALQIFTEYYEKNYSIYQSLMIHSPIVDAYSKGESLKDDTFCSCDTSLKQDKFD